MSAADALTVRPVSGRRDLKAFIELPFRLHRSSPQWVPPLRIERKLFLGRSNPFFTHGEAQLFLAERGGAVVGRISAHIDHSFNDHHGNTWGMFGFIEFEDDQEVVDALMRAAGDWLRERGRERMVGPMDFQMNDECGVLIDGFELDPMLKQPWHPPYYAERIAQAGLGKAMDLLMWAIEIGDHANVVPGIHDAAAYARDKHGIRLEKMTRRSLSKDIRRDFRPLYNAAWKKNWGYAPYTDADLKTLAQETQLVYTKEWLMKAVSPEGETIGMAITIPDLNQVLRKMNGRIRPWNIHHYLLGRKKIDRIRVGFLGVLPEWQHTGAAAVLFVEHYDVAYSTPVTSGEMGWILENNKSMNRAMEGLAARVVKRYRMYDQPLQEGVEPLPLPVPWDAEKS